MGLERSSTVNRTEHVGQPNNPAACARTFNLFLVAKRALRKRPTPQPLRQCGRTIVAVALAGTLFSISVFAREPMHRPLDLDAPVQDKNFYVLSLLERSPGAATAIAKLPPLQSVLEQKRAALEKAARLCETVTCIDDALRWTDADIDAVAHALNNAYLDGGAVRTVVDSALRDSGAYVRYDSQSGGDLLARAWTDSARAMNQVIDIYGNGKAPRYPDSDSASFDVRSPEYGQLVHTIALMLAEQDSELSLFFQPTLKYALYLLDINKRDEAGRLEPLERRENAPAIKRIAITDWARFPYTVILVPGRGSDRTTWALDPAGKLRIELAARRWREGKAPLILVSGGYVHPNQTPFSEALEMKRSLISDYAVPEDAILIDPQARHTSTNLRNAAREMYRYGVPFDREALITTDNYQSAHIESAEFAKRCEDQLGYVPYRILKRLSAFDLEWIPKLDSLQIDPVWDILDP